MEISGKGILGLMMVCGGPTMKEVFKEGLGARELWEWKSYVTSVTRKKKKCVFIIRKSKMKR